MTMTCTFAESVPNPGEQADSGCVAAAPNSDWRGRRADRLFLLFCQSITEIDALNDSGREVTIRGDLFR